MLALAVVAGCQCFEPTCSAEDCVDAGSAGGSVSGGGTTGGGVSGGGVSGGGNSSGGGVTAGGLSGGGAVGGGTTTDAGVPCSLLFDTAPVRFSAAPQCNHARALRVKHTCSAPTPLTLNLSGPDAARFAVVSPPVVTLPVGVGELDVEVRFSPVVLGTAQAVLTASAGGTTVSLALQGLAAVGPVTDSFQASRAPQKDLLLVVSDGPGMTAPQQSLGMNLDAFFRYATINQLDLRMVVVRGGPDAGLFVQGAGEPLATDSNQSQLLVSRLQLGSAGQPTVSCLSRAHQAVVADSSWRREDIPLEVSCFQNTLDQSSLDAGWIDTLRNVPPFGDVFVHALANFAPCQPPHDTVLQAFAQQTGGTIESICGLSGLPTSIPDHRRQFTLRRPVASDAGVSVFIDGQSVPANGGWRFERAWNAIVFERLFIPQPGSAVSVVYEPRCQ